LILQEKKEANKRTLAKQKAYDAKRMRDRQMELENRRRQAD